MLIPFVHHQDGTIAHMHRQLRAMITLPSMYPQSLLVTISVAFWLPAESTTPVGGLGPNALGLMVKAVPVRSTTPAVC